MEVLIIFDEKNANGRVYTKDSFKKIPETLPIVFKQTEFVEEVTNNDVVGQATNVKIMGNCLVADIGLYQDVFDEETFNKITNNAYVFVVNGVGELNNENVVINYLPIYLNMVLREESAYAELYAKANPYGFEG